MARRTVLFAPGDDGEKCRRAAASGADVVVFDLEDGVGPGAKDPARDTVRDVLGSIEVDAETCVRVNAGRDRWERDLSVAFAEGLPDAVMLPKVEAPSEVTALAEALDHRHRSLPLLAVIESARGLVAAPEIAAAGPTDGLVFGAQDLAADLGADPGGPGEMAGPAGGSRYAREQVLVAARAAGADAVDTHHPAYEDHEGLGEAAARAAAMGFDGKLAIHPEQVPTIHEAFRPPPARVAWAERVVAAVEAADGGVCVVDGEMIDAPQRRQAERILARAADGAD